MSAAGIKRCKIALMKRPSQNSPTKLLRYCSEIYYRTNSSLFPIQLYRVLQYWHAGSVKRTQTILLTLLHSERVHLKHVFTASSAPQQQKHQTRHFHLSQYFHFFASPSSPSGEVLDGGEIGLGRWNTFCVESVL